MDYRLRYTTIFHCPALTFHSLHNGHLQLQKQEPLFQYDRDHPGLALYELHQMIPKAVLFFLYPSFYIYIKILISN
jgi:hypothetical protein